MLHMSGAIFTIDEDRKQHLEKEAHGELRNNTTPEEMETAKEQEEYNERSSTSYIVVKPLIALFDTVLCWVKQK